MTAEPHVLIEKLHPVCRRALEQATEMCVERTHRAVGVEHLLVRLLEDARGEMCALLRHYDVSRADCLAELTRALDALEGGNRAPPALSPPLLRWMERAWLVSSLRLDQGHIRPGALLLALLDDELLRGRVAACAPTLLRVPRQPLRNHLRDLLRGPAGQGAGAAPQPPREASSFASSSSAEAAAPPSALSEEHPEATAAAVGAEPDPHLLLTPREREIAALIDLGLSNKEIARRLSLSALTVKNHVHRILEKLQVSRRGQAAARLRRPG
jgi:type VI secretion system protein VasG